jgi:DNA-binding transcriptional ArsR family regulator
MDVKQMGITVRIDWGSAYELVVSLMAFTEKQHHKTLDVGTAWVKAVEQQIGTDAARKFTGLRKAGFEAASHVIMALIYQCPGDRSAESFLEWLRNLSPGELYEALAKHPTPETAEYLLHASEYRARWLGWLDEWRELYFRNVPNGVLDRLAHTAAEMKQLCGQRTPEEVVALATKGLRIRPIEELREIVLVPQYHFAPWNLIHVFGSVRMHLFPVDLGPDSPDVPAPSLLRLTKALADESRLRILRFIAQQPRTFKEIVRFSGLTKGTVHHHLVALRAAGLVWVNIQDAQHADTYEINLAAIDALSEQVRQFLAGSTEVVPTKPGGVS